MDDEKENWNSAEIQVKDKNRCWIALKYTKPKGNGVTFTLFGPNNEIVIIMQAKKELLIANAFLGQLIVHSTEYQSKLKTTHFTFTKHSIGRAY